MEIENFKGTIEEPIGKRVKSFQVVGDVKEGVFEPTIFWLVTQCNHCYRFFSDAWIAHWHEYSYKEMQELKEEDFDIEDSSQIIDLAKEYSLRGKQIVNAVTDYIELTMQLIAVLRIDFAGGGYLELLDYGDEKDQELVVDS